MDQVQRFVSFARSGGKWRVWLLQHIVLPATRGQLMGKVRCDSQKLSSPPPMALHPTWVGGSELGTRGAEARGGDMTVAKLQSGLLLYLLVMGSLRWQPMAQQQSIVGSRLTERGERAEISCVLAANGRPKVCPERGARLKRRPLRRGTTTGYFLTPIVKPAVHSAPIHPPQLHPKHRIKRHFLVPLFQLNPSRSFRRLLNPRLAHIRYSKESHIHKDEGFVQLPTLRGIH
jgi:hypothetical protein